MITLKKYKDMYDYAPYELMQFAEGALQIKNCQDLVDCASEYLEAKLAFEACLQKYDIEVG